MASRAPFSIYIAKRGGEGKNALRLLISGGAPSGVRPGDAPHLQFQRGGSIIFSAHQDCVEIWRVAAQQHPAAFSSGDRPEIERGRAVFVHPGVVAR
jgi:hypothetical protein